MHWNGCNNILYINSFNHVFNACDFPSPILSIEYVTVIIGDIIIKNAIVTIRFTYVIKNIKVITHNIKQINVSDNCFINDILFNASSNISSNTDVAPFDVIELSLTVLSKSTIELFKFIIKIII